MTATWTAVMAAEERTTAVPAGKRCSRCREVKAVSDFGLNARCPDGRHRYCKTCRIEDNAVSNPRKSKQYRAWDYACTKARRLGAPTTLTANDVDASFDLHDGKCHCGCGKAADELDHIVAFALGGVNTAENTQWLSNACHVQKTRFDMNSVRARKAIKDAQS